MTLSFTEFIANREVKIEYGVETSFHFFFKVAILVYDLCRPPPAQISFCSLPQSVFIKVGAKK